MPSITRVKNPPRHMASRPTRSATTLKSTAPRDSVRFGANQPASPPPTPTENNSFLHTTPVIKNIYAGLKGFVQGAFGGPWNKHFARAAGWFGALLPFAIWIPGPHYILLPGYVLIRRAITGFQQMITGFKEPEKILKPNHQTTDTPSTSTVQTV